MSFPITHTQPTELMATSYRRFACHMHTALIFLDRRSTTGTFFGIFSYPFNSLTLVIVLLFPCLNILTSARIMRYVLTPPTKFMIAFTSDILSNSGCVAMYKLHIGAGQ